MHFSCTVYVYCALFGEHDQENNEGSVRIRDNNEKKGVVIDEIRVSCFLLPLFFPVYSVFLTYRLDRLPAFLTGADGLLLKVCRIRLTACRLAVERFRDEEEHLFMLRQENLMDLDGKRPGSNIVSYRGSQK